MRSSLPFAIRSLRAEPTTTNWTVCLRRRGPVRTRRRIRVNAVESRSSATAGGVRLHGVSTGSRPAGEPFGTCILLVELELVELCLSAATLAEVRDVLSRPELLNKFSSLTESLVEEFLDRSEERRVGKECRSRWS